jgi:hypothetical protein
MRLGWFFGSTGARGTMVGWSQRVRSGRFLLSSGAGSRGGGTGG